MRDEQNADKRVAAAIVPPEENIKHIESNMSSWFCYLLQSDCKTRTYVGATVNPDRRLRQHNCEITGGAYATKGRHWSRIALVSELPDERAALQFEWAWKNRGRKHGSGLRARLQGLRDVLMSEKSTSAAVPFSEWSSAPHVWIREDSPADLRTAILDVVVTIGQHHTSRLPNIHQSPPENVHEEMIQLDNAETES